MMKNVFVLISLLSQNFMFGFFFNATEAKQGETHITQEKREIK